MLLAGSGYPALVGAAKLTDKQRTEIAEPRPPGLPTDAELEAAGAVIGKIDIDIRNIFDENDPRENRGLYRLADRLQGSWPGSRYPGECAPAMHRPTF